MRLPRFLASIGNVLIAGLLLAACQTSIPMPFADDDSAEEASAPIVAEARSIEVETVEGPAVPMARLLAQSVADSLADRDIPATANGVGGSYYTLKSKARTNRDASSPTIVHIDWTLVDRDGREVGKHTMGVTGSWWEWVNGDPKVIRKVGQDTAKVVADMLRDPAEARAAQAAPRGLRVRPVTGAPGDGNTSLSKAIAIALKASDVPVADTADAALADLRGTVDMGEPDKHGQQVVRISWKVTRPDGSLVGEAHQENAVPAGSLDGPWGRVAGLAATAAVDGIKQILVKIDDDTIAGRAPAPEPTPAPAPEAVAQPAPRAVQPAPQAQPAPPRRAAPVQQARATPRETAPRPTPRRALGTPVADGAYRIQLASVRSPAKAEAAWKDWQRDNPAVLGLLKLAIVQVDLGPTRGVFYRLQAGPFGSKASAAAACETLKSNGMNCLTVKAE